MEKICEYCGKTYFQETLQDYNEHNGKSWIRTVGHCNCGGADFAYSISQAKKCSFCKYYENNKCTSVTRMAEVKCTLRASGITVDSITSLETKEYDICERFVANNLFKSKVNSTIFAKCHSCESAYKKSCSNNKRVTMVKNMLISHKIPLDTPTLVQQDVKGVCEEFKASDAFMRLLLK